jgi:hypothetical protein
MKKLSKPAIKFTGLSTKVLFSRTILVRTHSYVPASFDLRLWIVKDNEFLASFGGIIKQADFNQLWKNKENYFDCNYIGLYLVCY